VFTGPSRTLVIEMDGRDLGVDVPTRRTPVGSLRAEHARAMREIAARVAHHTPPQGQAVREGVQASTITIPPPAASKRSHSGGWLVGVLMLLVAVGAVRVLRPDLYSQGKREAAAWLQLDDARSGGGHGPNASAVAPATVPSSSVATPVAPSLNWAANAPTSDQLGNSARNAAWVARATTTPRTPGKTPPPDAVRTGAATRNDIASPHRTQAEAPRSHHMTPRSSPRVTPTPAKVSAVAKPAPARETPAPRATHGAANSSGGDLAKSQRANAAADQLIGSSL
jgi:hypothetical protein